ncbi:MAG: response regulator [Bdellovibrionales bacterium]|nr:response regulator [Bdellovibrionales bacterium]
MGKKLLVADDSLTIQKVIKLALSGDGYEIQTVSDGTECLQQVSLFRPDVVLIDVGLPGRSAFDIKKAANEDPDLARIPFILMSSAFEKVDEAKVALLKFDGRLTKPFDPSNLKGVLTAALQMNSGQAIREFVPTSAPSAGFSLEPSEKSRQMARPPISDNDVTGEIQLMDPKLIHSDPAISAPPPIAMPSSAPIPDPLWTEPSGSVDPHHDADIRNLTESTVKMSGLDDLGGWNIEESAKAPIPDIFTQTGLSQPDFNPNVTHPSISVPTPTPAPMPTQTGIAMVPPSEVHGLDFEIGSPTPGTNTSIPMPSATPTPPSPSFGSAAAPTGAGLESIVERQVREQLEFIVQGAVKTQLEQMARKALPEIAERVVKAEIRKMLEGLAGGSND